MMTMDWEEQQKPQQEELMNAGNSNRGNNSGGIFVKVMTDEQMEILRKQIAAYATICEQLVEMHKSLTSHPDLSGVWEGEETRTNLIFGATGLENLYYDPFVTSAGHKITGRHRWTPTRVQLEILECMFEQVNGTPSKQKIKDMTSELSQHGQISETNVYNWFQNRRARSKRKQQFTAPNNVESEAESANEKKTKSDDFSSQPHSIPREDLCFQNHEVSSGMHSVDAQSNKAEPMYPSNDSSKPARSMGQMCLYDTMLSNQRMDRFIGKMEVSGNYNPYLQEDDYNLTNC